MGNLFYVSRSRFLPVADQDAFTLISASSRRMRLREVGCNGHGTSAAPQEFQVGVSTGGTTGGGGLTPRWLKHSDAPAATTVVDTTWTVQPTMPTHTIPIGYASVGGAQVHVFDDDGGMEVRNGQQISIRCTPGTTPQTASIYCIFEED